MPRGGHYNPGRQAVYDRSPVGQALSYTADGVAPHGVTTRFTRTVPAGMRAVLQSAAATLLRVTAAAPVGLLEVTVTATVAAAPVRVVDLLLLTNAVGDTQRDVWSGELLLGAGDVLSGTSADASTGGTVDYRINALQTEFSQ